MSNEVTDADFAPTVQKPTVANEGDFAPSAVEAGADDFAPGSGFIGPIEQKPLPLSEGDIAEVKARVSSMPQYREGFFGPELVKETKAKAYAPWEYGKEVYSRTLGPHKDVQAAIDKADLDNPTFDINAPWSFQALKYKVDKYIRRQLAVGQAAAKRTSETNPINIVAQETVGAAGRAAQDWVGQPAGKMVLKEAMTYRPPSQVHTDPMGLPILDPDPIDPGESPEQKEFRERHKGAEAAELREPSKYVVPGSKETFLREFLSATASDKIKLQGAKREEALAAFTTAEVGGVSVAQMFAKGVDLAGELPYYALLTTGAGTRAATSRMSQIEAMGVMKPTERLSLVKGAERHAMGTEFAAQSAAVAAKNKEDVGESAVSGYVFGQVLAALGQGLTRGKGAKGKILSEENALRSELSDVTGVVVPPVTWAEYIKGYEESVARASATFTGKGSIDPNIRKGKDFAMQEGYAEPATGSKDAEFTFKTVEYGKAGEVREVRYLDNAKTGKRSVVYSAQINERNVSELAKSGSPEPTNRDAYGEWADIFAKVEKKGAQSKAHVFGKTGYMSPEQAVANVADSFGLSREGAQKLLDMTQFAEVQPPRSQVSPSPGSQEPTVGAKPKNVGPSLTQPVEPTAKPTGPTVEIAGHDIPSPTDGRYGTDRFDNPRLYHPDVPYNNMTRATGGLVPPMERVELNPRREGTITTKLRKGEEGLRRAAMDVQDRTPPDWGVNTPTAEMEQAALLEQNEALWQAHGDVENELINRIDPDSILRTKRAFEREGYGRDAHGRRVPPWWGSGWTPEGGPTDIIGDVGTRPPLPPRLLTVDANGNVVATPLVDRVPSTQGLSPRAPVEGDVVHLPDGQVGVVEKARDGELAVDLKVGKATVSPASVSLANENLLNLKDLLGPVKSAHPFPGNAVNEEFKIGDTVKTAKNQRLLKLKELDVKRVMNAAGIESPVEAKKVLDEMVTAGQLEKPVNGVWKVKKSYHPKAVELDPGMPGYRYYYKVSNDGQGRSGVVRGRDPKKLGHVLIEVGVEENAIPLALDPQQLATAQKHGLNPTDIFAKTKLISVPKADLRPYVPVLGNANLSQLPARFGINVPMPKDVLTTNTYNVQAMADYARMSGQLKKLLHDDKSFVGGLKKLFNHNAWLVPSTLKQAATTLAAQPGVVKAQTEVFQTALADRLGGELSLEDQWLSNIMKRRATRTGKTGLSEQERGMERFFRNNPQLAKEARDTIQFSLARLKELETALARRGVGNIGELEKLRALGLEDEYAMNVYMKYLTSRTNWAKFVKEQLPDVWKKGYEWVVKKFPNEDINNAEARMQELLGLDVNTLAKQMRAEPNGVVAKKLKERIQMATELKQLMGSLDSASIQMAHSLAASESILRRVQTWDSIAATPYWSPGPRADLGSHGGIEVPRTPIYGKAAGGRVHESMRFLLEAKSPMAEGGKVLRFLTSVWKFNQVVGGGAGPWVSQVMRNWKGLLISGGLQGPDDLRTFFDAAEEMLKYRVNPLLAKENGSMYDNAIQNGAIGTGFAGSEINKNKAANRILDAVRKQRGKGGDYWDIVEQLTSSIRGTAEEVGAMYDAIDRVFKLTAYMNNYRRCLSQGMTPHDAAAYSTMRNNQSFVNFEMVSAATDKMRNSSVSAAAPFISSKMEDLRINGTLMMRLKDEPDLMARLLVAGGVVGSTLALMREQRRANGISDERVAKDLDKRPLGMQAYKPISMVLPDVDKEGRLQVADFTMWEDMFMMAQIHERDFAPAAMLRNQMTGVFGEDTFIGYNVDRMFNAATGTIPLSAMPAIVERPGEQGWMQALQFIAENGGLPNAPFKGYRQYMMGQAPLTLKDTIYREQWTDEQVKWKLMGLPFAGPIGMNTEVSRAREFQRAEQEMQRQIQQTIMNKPEEKRQDIIDAKLKAIQEIGDEYQNQE